MAENSITTLSPTALVALSTQMSEAIGPGPTNPFNLPQQQADAMAQQTTTLRSKDAAVEAAKAAYHAAVQAREESRHILAAITASLARQAYATGVSPQGIAQLGLSPHSTSRAPLVPETPTGLVAVPQANGDLRLTWDRAGNGKGMNFLIEARVGGGAWAFVGDVTATRATLKGYAPDVTTSFRVSASKGGATSTPTVPVVAYALAPSLQLVEGGERKAA